MSNDFSVRPIPRDTWESVLLESPRATIFHGYDYLQFMAALIRAEFVPLGVSRGSELVGLFPVIRMRRGPFRIAGSPVSYAGLPIPYLGPAVADEFLAGTLQCFEAWLNSSHIDYSELRWDRLMQPLPRWETSPAQTVLVEIPRDEQALWKRFSKGCRSSIKKAQTAGVSVVEVAAPSFFDEYSSMAVDVYRKSRRKPPMTPAYFRGIWDLWHQSGTLRTYMASHEGKPLAGAIFALDDARKAAYYLDGVSYAESNALCPNNAVQWEFLKLLVSSGYERYDMLGAGIAGIRQFKLSFGGELTPLTYAFRTRSRAARIARDLYKRYRSLARYVSYKVSSDAAP